MVARALPLFGKGKQAHASEIGRHRHTRANDHRQRQGGSGLARLREYCLITGEINAGSRQAYSAIAQGLVENCRIARGKCHAAVEDEGDADRNRDGDQAGDRRIEPARA